MLIQSKLADTLIELLPQAGEGNLEALKKTSMKVAILMELLEELNQPIE